jgi:hypothetical protein
MSHEENVKSIVREYIPSHEQDFVEELLQDETDALLYGVITELKALRTLQTGDPQDAQTVVELVRQEMQQGVETTGTYVSKTVDLTTDDYEQILDLDFVAGELDLRFDDDIKIAYAEPSDPSNVVPYSASDSPVAGTRVRTNAVWAKAQNGTGGASVTIEAWGGR